MAADRQARDPLFSCLFDRRAGAERFECPVEHSPRIQAHLNGLRCEDSGRLEEGSFAVKITGGHPIRDEGASSFRCEPKNKKHLRPFPP